MTIHQAYIIMSKNTWLGNGYFIRWDIFNNIKGGLKGHLECF